MQPLLSLSVAPSTAHPNAAHLKLASGRFSAAAYGASPATLAAVGADQLSWMGVSKQQQVQRAAGDLITRISVPQVSTGFMSWVASSFVASILALDVLSLWAPRIGVSLVRGAEPYNPKTDPDLVNRPLTQQLVLGKWRQLKHLNWPNFSEESQREFASGPGILGVPTATYLLFKRGLLPAGDATFMAFPTVANYQQALAHHWRQPNANTRWTDHALSPQERLNSFRQDVREFLRGHVLGPDGHPAFQAHRKPLHLPGESKPTTLHTLLDDWVDTLSHITALEAGHESKLLDATAAKERLNPLHKQLATLGKALQEATPTFNETHRLDSHFWDKDTLPLLWQKTTGAAETTEQATAAMLRQLTQFKDMPKALFKQVVQAGPKAGLGAEKLPDLALILSHRMMGHKFWFSVANSALGLAWLYWLASWVLKSQTYPANRLMQITDAGPKAFMNDPAQATPSPFSINSADLPTPTFAAATTGSSTSAVPYVIPPPQVPLKTSGVEGILP